MKYSMTIAHLDEIKVKTLQKVNHLDEVGIMGNTGASDGAHVHIDCVEGVRPIRDYSLTDIYNGDPVSSKQQLDYCLGDLFTGGYRITTEYDEAYYLQKYKKHHMGYDVVPVDDDWTVHYPRTFTGRVAYAGYNQWYGNHVIIFFDILDDLQVEEEIIEAIPTPNTITSKYLDSNNILYEMTSKHTYNHTFGQEGSIRYIKLHPSNLGIIEGEARISDFDYPGINGTFFWWDTNGDPYPTSILKINETVFHAEANHLPYPQSVLCYYKDNTLGIEVVDNVNKISKPTWWAIGGVGLYDTDAEGFIGSFSDVWNKRNHTSIGYDSEGYIYLVRSYNVERVQTVDHLKSLGCIAYMGLDSGSSCQIQTEEWKRPSSDYMCRKVNTLLVALK